MPMTTFLPLCSANPPKLVVVQHTASSQAWLSPHSNRIHSKAQIARNLDNLIRSTHLVEPPNLTKVFPWCGASVSSQVLPKRSCRQTSVGSKRTGNRGTDDGSSTITVRKLVQLLGLGQWAEKGNCETFAKKGKMRLETSILTSMNKFPLSLASPCQSCWKWDNSRWHNSQWNWDPLG